jgi:hypothetical protein
MEATSVTVYSIEGFVHRFLNREQISALAEVFDEVHTWGDTDLVGINAATLAHDLGECGIPVPEWLTALASAPERVFFELDLTDFWLGKD